MANANKMPDPKHLAKIANAGFQLIPLHQWDAIGPRNRNVGKAPIRRDWWSMPSLSVGEATAHMATGGNIGILLGKSIGDHFICAYDIDIGNLPEGPNDIPLLIETIAEQLEVSISELVIHRSGNDGLHIFFLSTEADLCGHTHINGIKVELKSKGQQVVAPGSIHPETGRLYQVHPDSTDHELCPIAPDLLVEQYRKPSVTTSAPVMPPSRVNWVAEQLRAAIDIGVDLFEDYSDWIRGGMAFHAASGGENHGLEAWIVCSREGEADHCAYKWLTFGVGEVTEKTLNHYLASSGAKPSDAPRLTADEFAEYVASDFADLHDDETKSNTTPFLSLDDLLTLPEPEWLLKNAIPQSGLAVLYGPPKCAKTFLALDMALSVGSGRDDVHGFACKKGKVLYILAEGGASMMGQRTAAWMTCKGANSSDFFVLDKAVTLSSRKSIDQLISWMNGDGWDLVVVDTLARCMDGDENSVKDMNLAIKGCDLIRNKTNAAVLLVHHSGKDQSKGMRGSTALLGAVDSALKMRPFGDSQYVVAVEQLRHGEPGGAVRLRLGSVGKSAILAPCEATADFDPKTIILDLAAAGADKTPRSDFKSSVAEATGRSLKTANDLISRHIPFSRERATGVRQRELVWREKDPTSTSPRAELIRNCIVDGAKVSA